MSVAISNLATTWTNSGTTYTGVKLNVTDTASAAASLLMDLQVGGVSQFRVGKGGTITSTGAVTTSQGVTAAVVTVADNNRYTWASADAAIWRDAAQTLAQRNGTNAQVFRVYNTYTDASNYERGKIEWASNVLKIGTEAAGTGTLRGIEIDTRATTGGVYFRNANAGRTAGYLRVTANASSDNYFAFESAANTQLVFNGVELDVASNTGVHMRLRTDTARACWGVGVNFPLSTTSFQFQSVATGDTALAVQGAASQTGDLQRWVNSTGTTLLSVLAGGAIQLPEQTAPAAPAADNVRIYAEDNGAGKTRLMALFATGAAVQIAIEP